MSILGLNAHNEEEESQHLPKKDVLKPPGREQWLLAPTSGLHMELTKTYPPCSPTYILVVVTAQLHAAISRPPNLRATYMLHAREWQCMGTAGRFGKFLMKRFLHTIRMFPEILFPASSSPKAARQTV